VKVVLAGVATRHRARSVSIYFGDSDGCALHGGPITVSDRPDYVGLIRLGRGRKSENPKQKGHSDNAHEQVSSISLRRHD